MTKTQLTAEQRAALEWLEKNESWAIVPSEHKAVLLFLWKSGFANMKVIPHRAFVEHCITPAGRKALKDNT